MAGRLFVAIFAIFTFIISGAYAQDDISLNGLKFRSLGPAVTSGRIADFAFHPDDKSTFYVGTASGGLWKTTNNGNTWKSIFDGQASFSIGVVTLDPKNPNIVWVGTGENNSQRSVAYGDGVYKSLDGGKTWKHMGLKTSEHIGSILIDPRDSNTVFVAAQGPLWNSGGERGLYKTTDGGTSWERVLDIDEHTGINEVVMDQDNPDILIASSYQRQRRVWTLINGGPGSAIHKSTDGGKSWKKVTRGLPSAEVGRIGLATAPSVPGMVYALIEGKGSARGLYRSTDYGESWEKRSGYGTSSPQYYNEIFVDPSNADRIYAVDTFSRISEDGGKSFSRLGVAHRHVDDHAIWIDPDNSNHIYIGGDGGVYESHDKGANWRFIDNLPLAQFYRVTADNAEPFYHVYGGTQDNATYGAPSQTVSQHGITNADWYITIFGDGFQPRVDPTNPDTVYAEFQYGGLARFDKKTGEIVYIAPQPENEEDQLRWNWNTPLLISPHNPATLYYGAEKLFRSDDRGNTWRAISGDLSRGLDRNAIEIMGRVWSADSIAKNASTSLYGSLVAVDESPLKEGKLIAGTDDGLVHITEDGGTNWRKIESIKGIPDQGLVHEVLASRHDVDTLYVVVDLHKVGDFKPYIAKSTNNGRSWKVITKGLPERGQAHTIVEDHIDPSLLFAGTEFGVFVSQDGGQNWKQMKGDMPTISVRDLDIQRRENDLIVGTFGRGIYILDDYSPLRSNGSDLATTDATLLPAEDGQIYIERRSWGVGRKGFQGAGFYSADNPPYGVTFTYYLSEGLTTAKQDRQKAEKDKIKKGEDTPYPSWDALEAESREEKPTIILTIKDRDGNVVRRITGPTSKGFHRVTWDMHLPLSTPISLNDPQAGPFGPAPRGPFALPGDYTVSLSKRHKGAVTDLSTPQSFKIGRLYEGTFEADNLKTVQDFELKTARLQRAVSAAVRAHGEMAERIQYIKRAILLTPSLDGDMRARIDSLHTRMLDLRQKLTGRLVQSRFNEPAPWSISQRVNSIIGGHWGSFSAITSTHARAYDLAAEAFAPALQELKAIRSEIEKLENELEDRLTPWTPGRIPNWSAE
ncbi:glycosyl hydrolase [Kordiimonas sp. SCSIO 12610]|uniref:VPS10 domain-containing protein n=1 Tax=Kordiimonas sp. SCSIO 12610 TaxID=2829597 RepID=UPI00210D4BF6|nr:glycosyl hydrolase [Kordiimonas sp. SCSIO 12610]UTW54742.1 glycosyl hydrolase [Kordiimonas sp. SCSIO 12610]